MWDLYIFGLLLLVCSVVPYRVAFVEEDTETWIILYWLIDICFLIDMILSFFTSVSDESTSTEIVDRKEIARIYLKGWFWIDLAAIFPIDQLLNTLPENSNLLFRFFKIGKLYKLIRITRLFQAAKVLKSKDKLLSQYTKEQKIGSGEERMMFFLLFLVFCFHIAACAWIVVAKDLETSRDSWLNSEYGTYSDPKLYCLAIYFIVTTMTTVGFGDMSASTSTERIYCIILMLAGVAIFSYISGALASLLSSYDAA